MRILLFDIDGTLLITDSGGKGALERAMSDEFQLSSVDVELHFAGRTDRSLLNELLQRNGLDINERNRRRLSERYVQYLPGVLDQRGGKVLPGVKEILNQITEAGESACYVMTGNLNQTATHKLKHFDLLHYFDGIFGGDHDTQREDLARRTRDTLEDRLGENAIRQVVVIGDTPDDIRCGHAIGAEVIAVCTGSYGRQALEAEKPAAVYDDLLDFAAVNHLLDRS
ncbi:MAG: HAD family hydrolase [Planctomycetota bacterium]